MEEEGSILVRDDGPKATANDLSFGLYNLYFKGLVGKDSLAGFGVAICRQENNNLMFQMKGSIQDSSITVLEAELTALKRGLTEAVSLGMTHISICCDDYKIYELVIGSCYAPEQEKIALLMVDVQRIRQQLTSSIPVLMTGNLAYKLAMETLISQISIRMPPSQNNTSTTSICLDFKASRPMSETKEDGSSRCCCNCKASRHTNLSCNHYERLNPNPKSMWRQCKKW